MVSHILLEMGFACLIQINLAFNSSRCFVLCISSAKICRLLACCVLSRQR